MPPGSAMPSRRAAMLTLSPRMSSPSARTSPTWRPTRYLIRRSRRPPAAAAMLRCTTTAQRTPSIALATSIRMPSPVVLTMRPRCSAIFGSITSRRSALIAARAFLVRAHQPRITRDIGGQDRNYPARRGGVAIGRAAAQYALDPRQELARLEGLRDVVIGAGLQPNDSIHRVGGRGHHDDADAAALLAQPARQCKSALARQPDIERHQRRTLAFDQPMQCGATLERTDPKILPGEIVGQQLPLRRLVLDHDDMGPRIHRLPAGELATIC